MATATTQEALTQAIPVKGEPATAETDYRLKLNQRFTVSHSSKASLVFPELIPCSAAPRTDLRYRYAQIAKAVSTKWLFVASFFKSTSFAAINLLRLR